MDVPALSVMTSSSGKYSTTPEYDDIFNSSSSDSSTELVILSWLAFLIFFWSSEMEFIIKSAPVQDEANYHDGHAYCRVQRSDVGLELLCQD